MKIPSFGNYFRTILFSVSAILTLIWAACSSSSPTPTPTPTPTVSPAALTVVLPADDAPHADANTEWWYYNGHLTDAAGSKYGFHYAIFRVTVPGFPPVDIGQAAISDVQKGAYLQGQRLAIGGTPTSSQGFDFYVGNSISGSPGAVPGNASSDVWSMAGYGGSDTLAATLPGYAFNLALASEKAPALHGGTGLVDFGVAGKSYYYSRTRMDVTGSITVGGKESKVTGLAWFDHQWGNFQPQDVGWDWFALQLDDGTDVMLSVLFGPNHKPLYNYGTVVTKDGQRQDLTADHFRVQSTGSWTSPTTGIAYPSGWQVAIPKLGVDVAVTPLLLASEFDARQTTQNVYWEGDVAVSGTHTGVGYVELTGYGATTAATR